MAPSLIDRSNNNGTDDYARARRAGVCAAYFKATEGTSFVDSTHDSRKASAHAAGLLVGSYHFFAEGDPRLEALFFLSHVGRQRHPNLRVCLDAERNPNTNTEPTPGWVEIFAKTIHSHLGYWPVLYASTALGQQLRTNATVRKCAWWRAEWSVNDGNRHLLDGGNQGAAAHQYTSKGIVPGCSGFTDSSTILNPIALRIPRAWRYTIRNGRGKLLRSFGTARKLRQKAPIKSLLKKFRKLVIRRESR